ncbi:MAG: gliding motility protein GldL [Muribaculaceae bacterium]|nr:gliding motility protein GldL [Muribaculaceae bacterium]
MGKIKRYRNVVTRFIASDGGQRFFNFAYSIGAAIVIWGALFKILHLPGGNMLLSIGMGTEVLMFILSAFDRPAPEYKWEKVYPVLAEDVEAIEAQEASYTTAKGTPTVIIGSSPSNAASAPQYISSAPAPAGDGTGTAANVLDQMQAMAAEMQQLRESTHRLNEVSDTLLQSYKAITDNSDNITANSAGYVDQMQALNRNIQGLNTIYEIQLKSVSSQLDAIDRVNRGIKEISDMYINTADNTARYSEEAEKLAENMKRLNEVYEKMLTAMTVNMNPGAPRS